MASHDETAIPAAPLYDGKATDRPGVCQSSSSAFLPVYVLVLMVSFAGCEYHPAEPWVIVTRGILNTSAEDS
ncbi:hypothetical protein BOO94_13240 [Pseudomonas sp. FSL W5-0299]|nr:hypothetical protein BOO94_13240 [Pseudomonas sp. FSL W5-0299]